MTRPPDEVESDEVGSSAERTRLAWRRTVLAGTVLVLLFARVATLDGLNPPRAAALAFALVGWIVLARLAHHRIQSMAHHAPAVVGRTLPATALVIAGFAVLGLVLIVADHTG